MNILLDVKLFASPAEGHKALMIVGLISIPIYLNIHMFENVVTQRAYVVKRIYQQYVLFANVNDRLAVDYGCHGTWL